MASGFRHYAGLKGTKYLYVGSDQTAFNYTTIDSAITAAQNGDTIIVEPGTYSYTAAVDLTKCITIEGKGRVVVNGGTLGLNSALLNINVPASLASDFYLDIKNIDFANAYAAAKVIDIDNDGGANKNMYINFIDCSFDSESTSTTTINVDQTNTSKDIFLTVTSTKYDVCDASTINLKKAGSRVRFINMDLGVLALGTTNVASIVEMYRCLYASAAQTSGGSASLIFNAWDCVSKNSGAIAAQIKNDFDATSASENVTTNTLL